jgi:diaminopimelate epimerase
MISVDMGLVSFAWQDIPLREPVDTRCLPIASGALRGGVAVNVGNPHAVFFVDRVDEIALEEIGPRIEHDPLFPERINVEIVERLAPDHLRVRVWERGVGVTRACGTGACAVVAAAADRGVTGRSVTVELDGGPLRIDWQASGHIAMTGPAATSFTGTVDLGRLETGHNR